MLIRRTIPHNKPIASVIKNYMDKKSGKVSISRDEIQRRFFGLDWKDQKKILNAFLDAGKTDREWAYLKLLNIWDPSFETRVRELWEEYHDDRCAWVIIRHFPVEYLKKHTEELIEDRNYYFICRRMAEDAGSADFEINRDLLSATDYLMALYHAHRHINDKDAKDILFQIVHDISINRCAVLELSRHNRLDKKEMISACDFSKVSMALYYLKKMGNEEVVRSFKKWDAEMQEKVRQRADYIELLQQVLSDFRFIDRLLTIVQKQLYLSLPERYKNQTDMHQE